MEDEETWEEPEYCCCCFPIRCGLVTFGILTIISGIGFIFKEILLCAISFDDMPFYTIISSIATIAYMFVFYFYMAYIIEDNKDTQLVT